MRVRGGRFAGFKRFTATSLCPAIALFALGAPGSRGARADDPESAFVAYAEDESEFLAFAEDPADQEDEPEPGDEAQDRGAAPDADPAADSRDGAAADEGPVYRGAWTRYSLNLGLGMRPGDGLRQEWALIYTEDDGGESSPLLSLGLDSGDDSSSIFRDDDFLEVQLQQSAASGTTLVAGRLDNPFIDERQADVSLLDRDFDLNGAYLRSSLDLGGRTRVSGTFGAFMSDGFMGSRDPSLLGVQLGISKGLGRSIDLRLSASGYQYRSRGDGSSTGRLVGLEAGDAGKRLRVGLGLLRVEADSVLRDLADLDGAEGSGREVMERFANRKGLVFFASRKLDPRLELGLTLFEGEAISGRSAEGGDFASSRNSTSQGQLELRFSF